MTEAELEYCTMAGYVTQEYSIEWDDAAGTRWRKVSRIINLGRADRDIRPDPDAAMVVEGPGGIGDPVFAKQPKTERLLAQVRDLLAVRPMTAMEIARMANCTVDRAKGLIRNHPEEFRVVKRTRAGCWYVCADAMPTGAPHAE